MSQSSGGQTSGGGQTHGGQTDGGAAYNNFPSSTGTYIKIGSCTKSAASRPYWECENADTKFSTNVAVQRNGVWHWDYNSDPDKTGFGLQWKQSLAPCVTCTLRGAIYLLPDSTYKQHTFKKCSGSGNWEDVAVSGGGGTCKVVYKVIGKGGGGGGNQGQQQQNNEGRQQQTNGGGGHTSNAPLDPG